MKEVLLNLNIQGEKKAISSVAELRQEVKLLEDEFEQATFGTDKFDRIQKELQAANAELFEFDKTLENIKDPVKTAEAYVKMGEGIAGGFAAAQGAAVLLNIETENVEKLQVKAQGAIAIAMGARAIAESRIISLVKKSSLAQAAYTAVVGGSTGALKLLKIALVSTGIGAIAVALGILVANWGNWSKSISETFEKIKKFIPGLKQLQQAFNFLKKKATEVGEAMGLVADESERAAKAAREAALETLDVVDGQLQREIELIEARGQDATEARRKWLNRRVELLKEALDTEDEESVKAYEEAQHKLEVFEANQTRIQQEAAQRRWEERQKTFKEQAELMNQLAQEIADEQGHDEGGMISTFLFGKDEERAKEAARQRMLERAQFIRDIDALIEEEEEEEDPVFDLGREHELRLQFIREGHSAEQALEMAHTQWLQEERDRRLKIALAIIQSAEAVFNGLADLMTAFGKEGKKNERRQRALAKVQLIIDQAKAIAGAVAAAQAIPFPGNLVAVATGVGTVMANFANAKKTLASIGEDPGGDVGTSPGISTPTFGSPTISGGDTGGGGETGGADSAEDVFEDSPGRSYVLEGDVTDAQEARERIDELAGLE
jgi:hypothetical protein